MPEIIDVAIVLDTEALNRAYPYGVLKHTSWDHFDAFFKVLVDKDHSYHDSSPDVVGTQGIKCNVNDMLSFRAMSKADTNHDVIITEFSDMSEGTAPSEMTDYISIPAFRTSEKSSAFYYDNGSLTKHYVRTAAWDMWEAQNIQVEPRKDAHMNLQALKTTDGLQHKHIRYTLGFKVSYPGTVRQYWFDPAIKIQP